MKKIALFCCMFLITGTVFAQTKKLPIWKTITIDSSNTSSKVLAALKEKGVVFPFGWAGPIEMLIDSTPYSKTVQKIDLVLVTNYELGLPDSGARFEQVLAAGEKLGLIPCPAEVGPLLRLQYMNQPLGEYLTIAMEPIHLKWKFEDYVYYVANSDCNAEHVGKNVLTASDMHGNVFYSKKIKQVAKSTFVFRRLKT